MTRPTLAASAWPEEERQRYWEIQKSALPGNPPAEGYHGAVSTALNGLAARAGLEALKQGGSAIDAAITSALTQVVLGGGAVVSAFGIAVLMYYDAEQRRYSAMNAGWNTCLDETDPRGIPGAVNFSASTRDAMRGTVPSGRTALVGGFMRGLEEAHVRFGRLAFERLFEPAIELAENGIPVSAGLEFYYSLRRDDLARLPATRQTFLKANGEGYTEGEILRQPELAETLRQVARHGADYMYTGPWAQKLVQAVRADGGNMQLEDLRRYRPQWGEPVHVSLDSVDAYFPPEPCVGTAAIVESLHLTRAAGIAERGHWSSNAESLRRLALCCSAAGGMRYESPEEMEAHYRGFDMSPEGRLSARQAEKMWERLDSPDTPVRISRQSTHSDDVVVVDRWGNMASLCHTINCFAWGKTAISVDGVTIGDPASYQQELVAAAGPGNQLTNPIELGILARRGEPEIAWSSMGVGLHYQSTQNLVNVIDFGMSIDQSVDCPGLLLPTSPDDNPMEIVLRVVDGSFSPDLLRKTGFSYISVPENEVRFVQGLWVAVERDPSSGALRAISPRYTNGWASAF